MSTPPQDTPRGSQGSVSPGDSDRSNREDIKDTARHLAEEAKAEGEARMEGLRQATAGKAETLAESVEAAASTLREDDVGHLSEYVSDLATRISEFSSSLRDKSGDEILHDVTRIARENPALFVTGSIAIGFGLARFARASGKDTDTQRFDADRTYSPYAGSTSSYTGSTTRPETSGDTAGYTASGDTTPRAPGTANPIRPGTNSSGSPSGTQGGIH